MYWYNKNLTNIFNFTRASNTDHEYTGHFILQWPIYKSESTVTAMLLYSSDAQRPPGVVIALGETPWELAMTVLPFLGRWGMKIQEAYHAVCPVHTHGQVSNYSNASSWRSPPLTGLAAQSCLICQPVLEGKCIFPTLKYLCLGWQQYSGDW